MRHRRRERVEADAIGLQSTGVSSRVPWIGLRLLRTASAPASPAAAGLSARSVVRGDGRGLPAHGISLLLLKGQLPLLSPSFIVILVLLHV